MHNYPVVANTANESILVTALAIDLLAMEETGHERQTGEDLRIELLHPEKGRKTHKLAFRPDGHQSCTWPVLTTIICHDGIDRDRFTLTPRGAIREVFKLGHEVPIMYRTTDALNDFDMRLQMIVGALNDTNVLHYVEYEAPK